MLKKKRIVSVVLVLMMLISLNVFGAGSVYAAQTSQWWDLSNSANYSQTSEPTGTIALGSVFGGKAPFTTNITNPDGTITTITGTQYWAWSCQNPTNTKQRVRVYVPSTANQYSGILQPVNNSSWISNNYPTLSVSASYNLATSLNSQGSLVAEALERNMIILVNGARSRGDMDAAGNYNGQSPATVVDTKAALRFLRANMATGLITGNPNLVFVTGTSGGGALSSLVAADGNSSDFYPALYAEGAAGMTSATASTISDAYEGAIAYCPITDLGMADQAYEFTYNPAREGRALPSLLSGSKATLSDIMVISDKEAGDYANYINGLGLKSAPDSTTALKATYTSPQTPATSGGVTGGTYKDAMVALLEKGMNKAINEWATGSNTAGSGTTNPNILVTGNSGNNNYQACVQVKDPKGNTITTANLSSYPGGQIPAGSTAKITDFAAYCAQIPHSSYKTAPAFDNLGTYTEAGQYKESNLVGAANQAFSHWDQYAWETSNTGTVASATNVPDVGLGNTGLTWNQFLSSQAGQAVALQSKMTSPIPYLLPNSTMPAIYQVGNNKADIAPFWYVRHGSQDCDTSFANQTTLYYALVSNPSVNQNYLNFEFAFGRVHEGNYDTQEAVAWLDSVLHSVVSTNATASVEKLNGNKNNLTVTVTETLLNGDVVPYTATISIDNNAAGTYTVGPYKVYVDTKGNTQIRECYIVK